jgi:hypothetical protein
MQSAINAVVRKASWKTAALSAAIFACMYALINLSGVGMAGLLKITGGAGILDFEFGYGQKKAYEMLNALGAEGRAFYLAMLFPLDYLFPFSYMLFYGGSIALLLKHSALNEKFGFILVAPALAMLSDWTENVGIIAMLRDFPDLRDWSVMLASSFGMLKLSCIYGSLAAMGALLALCARLWIKSRGKRRSGSD